MKLFARMGDVKSKWVIGRRELPLSHHGGSILSDQVERREMNRSVPAQLYVEVTGTCQGLLRSVNAVTPNPKLRSARATDPSSKTAR